MIKLGHFESVSVKNSTKKIKIYVPHIVEKIYPPILITGLWLIGFYSTGDRIVSTEPMILFVFFLIPCLMDLFYISYRITSDRNLNRMINGELVSKIGELYEISKWSTDPKGVRVFYRFAIKGCDVNGEYFNEIYEMPTKLYQKYLDHDADKYRIQLRDCCFRSAYLVEIIFLPPINSPEFSHYESSNRVRNPSCNNVRLPISKAEVIEIIYKKKLPYPCPIDSANLFARW